MKIHIKDTDLELHYSMRMYIIYENIMGQALSMENKYSYTSLIVLLYSAIVASIQKAKINMVLSYDEFMDWLDDNSTAMQDFSVWFTEQMAANTDLADSTKDKKEQEVKQGN